MQLDGKTVVITGGATGIGFALAREMGAKGARIVIGEPRRDRLDKAVAELARAGVEAAAHVCDVTDEATLEALADVAHDRFGSIDIAIANAGVGGNMASTIDTSDADARALFDVNFFGVWNTARVFGKRFAGRDTPAAIYAVASENALFNAFPFGGAAYVASKHAVFGLMDALYRDTPDHLTVGVILPGWVRSELSEFNRTAPAAMPTDDYARIVVPQIEAGERYIVSHPYNMARFDERYEVLRDAFARNAPRYEGDDEHDVLKFAASMGAGD